MELRVSTIARTTIQGLFSAAALHLGEAMPDGRTLEQPDPQEAWLALLSAGALLDQFYPLLSEEVEAPYRQVMQGLAERLAERHADIQLPMPATDPTPLEDVVRAAWERSGATE